MTGGPVADGARRPWPAGRRWGLVAVVGLALLLRLAAALAVTSAWRDEANDVFVSRESAGIGALLRTLRDESSPPLRFLLVEYPLHHAFPRSLRPLRLAEALVGSAAVAAVLAVGWRAFGPRAGLLAGLLMALAPELVRSSVDLRSPSLYQLTAALFALAMVALVDRPTRRRALLAGLAGGLLLLTHYFGAYLVGAAILAAAVLSRSRAGRAAAALAGVVAGLLFLPWLPWFMAQVEAPLRPDAVPHAGWGAAVAVLSLPLGWPALLLALAALVPGVRPEEAAGASGRGRRMGGLLAAGALGGNLLAWGGQWIAAFHAPVLPRYLVGPAIWLLPLAGAALAGLPKGRWGRVATALVTAGLVASAAVSARAEFRPRSSAPRVARMLERNGQPGDLVLMTHGSVASSLNLYYRGGLEQWAVPFRGRVTHVPWSRVEPELRDPEVEAALARELAARLETGHRVWLVTFPKFPVREPWIPLTADPPVGADPGDPGSPPTRPAGGKRLLPVRRAVHEELVRVLYTYGQEQADHAVRPRREQEGLGLLLFEPRAGAVRAREAGEGRPLDSAGRHS